MRAFMITMVILLVISQVSKASKLEMMRKGHTPSHPTEGVLALSLLIDMGIMAWGVVLLLN